MKSELKVRLLKYTPEPEKLVSAAAKLCYSNSKIDEIMENLTEDNIKDFLNILIDMGHASPLEHVNFTFGIEGVSRSLTHQLVRHRLASYSQKSQRYVTEGQFEYIIPPEIEGIPLAKEKFINAMKKDQEIYDELVVILKKEHYSKFYQEGKKQKVAERLAEKKAIEDARYILPNACETKIIVTMNVRELTHFFKHRCCERAQWEIRFMATEMLKQVSAVSPILFKKCGPSCLNNACPEQNMTCGKIKEVRKKFDNL